MWEGEIEQQFKAIEQRLAVTGESLEALRQKHREHIDDLRLELEALRQSLFRLHPELAEYYEAIRREVIQEVDPEKG
jgi:regulator of replication initiation timing